MQTWNWGDGSANLTMMGTSPAYHSYTASGTYTVTLTTSWTQNNVTCTQTSTQTVTYTAPTLHRRFTGSGTGTTRTYTAINGANTPRIHTAGILVMAPPEPEILYTHTFAYGVFIG
jgi:hypothetical protein